MKANTVQFTWMAFSLAAIVMLGLQGTAAKQPSEQSLSQSYSIERNADHSIQPVSLPVVTRQVSQTGPHAQQRQTWTF